jgi:hypothetical protein
VNPLIIIIVFNFSVACIIHVVRPHKNEPGKLVTEYIFTNIQITLKKKAITCEKMQLVTLCLISLFTTNSLACTAVANGVVIVNVCTAPASQVRRFAK